jgi:hypothetical protein
VLSEADALVTRVHAETVGTFLTTEHFDRSSVATVETADAVGWSSQSIEAQAFAYLAGAHAQPLADHVPGDNRSQTNPARRHPGRMVDRMANLAQL